MVCDSINVLRQLNNFGKRNKQEYYEKKEQKIKKFCKLIPKDFTGEIGNFGVDDLIYTFAKGDNILEPTKKPKKHNWEVKELQTALKSEMEIMQYLMKKHKNGRALIFHQCIFCSTFNTFARKIAEEKTDMIEYSQDEQNKINKKNAVAVKEYILNNMHLPKISEELKTLEINNESDYDGVLNGKDSKKLALIYQRVRGQTIKTFCESIPKSKNAFARNFKETINYMDNNITLEKDDARRGRYMQTMQNCIDCLSYLIVNHKHSKFQNMADLFGKEIDCMMEELGYNNKNNQQSTYNSNDGKEKNNELQ